MLGSNNHSVFNGSFRKNEFWQQYSEDQNFVPVIIVKNPSIDHYHNVKLDLFNFCWMKIKETEKNSKTFIKTQELGTKPKENRQTQIKR